MPLRAVMTLLLSVCMLACGCDRGSSAKPSDLTLFCAAGVQAPVEAIREAYGEELGVEIRIQYGGSGTLLNNLQVAQSGDLYLAADESYLDIARSKGLVAETVPIATQRPVIAVPKGNPKGIESVADLCREGVSIAIANPDAAAVGKLTRRAFEESGDWNRIEDHVRVYKPTVNDVANDVRLGAVDAGIIWDAIANLYDGLEAVPVPELDSHSMRVTIGVLSKSESPTEALRFARFAAAADRGLIHFEKHGFVVEKGDPWEKKPELLVFSGAMLRPGLERAIARFEAREGVVVNTVYNGCGVLTAQMKSGAEPSAYVSCDLSFMEQVQDRFLPSAILTENDLVILIPKGNPKGIAGLADLAVPGLRLGLAHEEKSALGHLTVQFLRNRGLHEAVTANRVVDAATGDFLVNQIRTGSLDAVIVYRSNAMSAPVNLEQHLDLIDIEGAVAVQPYAVARNARHQHLLRRFFDAVTNAESRGDFETFGFRWRVTD